MDPSDEGDSDECTCGPADDGDGSEPGMLAAQLATVQQQLQLLDGSAPECRVPHVVDIGKARVARLASRGAAKLFSGLMLEAAARVACLRAGPAQPTFTTTILQPETGLPVVCTCKTPRSASGADLLDMEVTFNGQVGGESPSCRNNGPTLRYRSFCIWLACAPCCS